MQAKFEVVGIPRGKQRARTVRNQRTGKAMTYTPDQTVIYENMVAYSYQEQCRGIFLEGAIKAEIEAYFPIPKSTSKKNRAEMLLGKIYHTKKIDSDNLAKAVLDSINKIAYHDDSQVAWLVVRKQYGEIPKVVVTLTEL